MSWQRFAAGPGKGLLQALTKAYRQGLKAKHAAAATGRGTRMDRYLIFIHNYLEELTST